MNETHKAKKAGKDKELWYEFLIEEHQQTPNRIENTAKAIAGIISITLTLLISLLQEETDVLALENYKTVIVLWLISAILSFFVIFPFPYRYSQLSINSFIKSHRRTILIKYTLLIISTILYLTGMLLLVIDIICKF